MKKQAGLVLILVGCVVIALLAAGAYFWTRPVPDQWESLRQQAKAYVAQHPGSPDINSYVQSHWQSAVQAAEGQIPAMPSGYEMGLASYLDFVKSELSKQAVSDKRADVLKYLIELPKPPPGRNNVP